MSFLKNNKAFTLVELIVVITVIGILTGGVALSITGNAERARDTRRKTDLQQIKAALEFYRSNNIEGYYPRTATTGGGQRYLTGSNPTYTYPALVPTYMESMPVDPSSTSTNVINYVYAPVGPGGAACNNTTVYCTTYTLTATEMEAEPDYVVTPTSVD